MASGSGLRRLPVEIKARDYLQMKIPTVSSQIGSGETGSGALGCGDPTVAKIIQNEIRHRA
jgi:hypothetical protein